MLIYIIFAVLVGHINCAPRILGGRYASPGQFPYQVTLRLNGYFHCGGSIISETFIVTAAHCLVGHHPLEMKATVGNTRLVAGDGQSFSISNFIIHPRYAKAYDYDIALIRLSNPMTLGTSTVKKIEMVAPGTIVSPNTMGVVSGFGAINAYLQMTNNLQYAYVPVFSRDKCNTRLISFVTDRMICAGIASGQISSCQGDSGGPLVVNNKLIGVVSFGPGCGGEGHAMYASVAVFRSWIKQHTGV